jgi:DNA repair protein RecN (Recombination protein N)
MLNTLTIQNYALINKLEIDFYSGFSILTGETGAGKSIILGALSLILGQRADKTVLRNKDKKCIVEAVFDIKPYQLKHLFDKYDVDYEDISIIRREIQPNGKSRAFINDTPVNLSSLKDIADQLIDIHSQHESLHLGNSLFQIDVIDTVAGHQQLLAEFNRTYTEYKHMNKELEDVQKNMDRIKADRDYHQFQFDQLENANLTQGEQQELEKELNEQSHVEEIKESLSTTADILINNDYNLVGQSKESSALLEKIRQLFPKAAELTERLESVHIELKDIASEIELIAENMDYDPQRLQFIQERLDLIYSLEKKHNVSTIEELLKVKEEIENKLQEADMSDFTINELKKKIDHTEDNLNRIAKEISNNRSATIPKIEAKVRELLVQLGMINASFKIAHTKTGYYTSTGTDEIQFLFSANKKVKEQNISKVASGGELSRLMLSLKYIISNNKSLPTIIFDEIDTGVSGEIAFKMGNILKNMAQNMQVVNITHLPQIAGKGDHHYLVYKQEGEQATNTYIKLLNKDERLTEIAKMLSGEELTEAAYNNARELMAFDDLP